MRIKDSTIHHLCGNSSCVNRTHLWIDIPQGNCRQEVVQKQEVPEIKVNPKSRKMRLD